LKRFTASVAGVLPARLVICLRWGPQTIETKTKNKRTETSQLLLLMLFLLNIALDY